MLSRYPPRVVLRAVLVAALLVLVASAPAPPARADEAAVQKLQRRADALLKEFGDGYKTKIDLARNMVYISALDEETFLQVTGALAAYRDAQTKRLFPKAFAEPVAIVFPTERHYRERVPWTKATGFYNFRERTLTSINLSGVMIHEFTHALHHNDMVLAGQQHPIWIIEGLATLFQIADFRRGVLATDVDHDLEVMQLTVRAGQAVPLTDFLKLDQKAFMEHAKKNYRLARYLMLYLDKSRKLDDFYAAYKKSWNDDPTGAKALEKVFDRPLEKIEKDWHAWVQDQAAPWKAGGDVVAHLGIRMKPDADGVKVVALLRGSAARRGGVLRRGDIIVSIAGRPTATPQKLTETVRSLLPGQTVSIELVRDGKRIEVKQLLGGIRSRAD